MFGDQLKMSDGVGIKLDCKHEFTGGEMKCKHCGVYFTAAIQHQVVDNSTIQWTDGVEYLKTHDV